MLNLNKRTKTKSETKPTLTCKNCSYACAYHCAQLPYTTESTTSYDNFLSYHLDTHHGSDTVYWGEGQTSDSASSAQTTARIHKLYLLTLLS